MIPSEGGPFEQTIRRALIAVKAQDWQRAAIEWSEAVRLRPGDGAAWSNLGETFRRLGRLPEAIQALRRATELAPRLAEAWFCLGTALKSIREFPEARGALERAVAIDPAHARG